MFLSCWTELDENFNRLKKPSNTHIQPFLSPLSIHSFILKMVAYKSAVVMVVTELVNSDDEKDRWEKPREWIKRRSENGYFQNIFQELKVPNGLHRNLPHECLWLQVLLKPISWPHINKCENQWRQAYPIRQKRNIYWHL